MRKFSSEEKMQICEEYLLGKKSSKELCEMHWPNLEKPPGVFWSWISRYRKQGATAFFKGSGNRSYTKDMKERAVKDYLAGTGSLLYICEKYDIPSDRTLINWIKLYNANMELKDYKPNREVYMAEVRRKTTMEERKEIVAYCIDHNHDYKGTAAKFDVSYSQVYSWVKKYHEDGESGLEDKRGRHKRDDELSELERLRRENRRLKRQLEERDMLCELLKKVRELEGM